MRSGERRDDVRSSVSNASSSNVTYEEASRETLENADDADGAESLQEKRRKQLKTARELKKLAFDNKKFNSEALDATFVCVRCGSSFLYYAQLRSHEIYAHADLISGSESTDRLEPTLPYYRCAVCSRITSDIPSYLQHVMDSECRSEKRRLKALDSCVCLLCGFATTRNQLHAHFRDVHEVAASTSEPDDIFSCPICTLDGGSSVAMASVNDLLMHLSTWHPTAIILEKPSPGMAIRVISGNAREAETRPHIRTGASGRNILKDNIRRYCYRCRTHVPSKTYLHHRQSSCRLKLQGCIKLKTPEKPSEGQAQPEEVTSSVLSPLLPTIPNKKVAKSSRFRRSGNKLRSVPSDSGKPVNVEHDKNRTNECGTAIRLTKRERQRKNAAESRDRASGKFMKKNGRRYCFRCRKHIPNTEYSQHRRRNNCRLKLQGCIKGKDLKNPETQPEIQAEVSEFMSPSFSPPTPTASNEDFHQLRPVQQDNHDVHAVQAEVNETVEAGPSEECGVSKAASKSQLHEKLASVLGRVPGPWKKPHNCLNCRKEFPESVSYFIHSVSNFCRGHKGVSLERNCPLCNEKIKTAQLVLDHIRRCHCDFSGLRVEKSVRVEFNELASEIIGFTNICTKCGRGFHAKTRCNLSRPHLGTKIPIQKMIFCNLCNRRLKSDPQLILHLWAMHDTGPDAIAKKTTTSTASAIPGAKLESISEQFAKQTYEKILLVASNSRKQEMTCLLKCSSCTTRFASVAALVAHNKEFHEGPRRDDPDLQSVAKVFFYRQNEAISRGTSLFDDMLVTSQPTAAGSDDGDILEIPTGASGATDPFTVVSPRSLTSVSTQTPTPTTTSSSRRKRKRTSTSTPDIAPPSMVKAPAPVMRTHGEGSTVSSVPMPRLIRIPTSRNNVCQASSVQSSQPNGNSVLSQLLTGPRLSQNVDTFFNSFFKPHSVTSNPTATSTGISSVISIRAPPASSTGTPAWTVPAITTGTAVSNRISPSISTGISSQSSSSTPVILRAFSLRAQCPRPPQLPVARQPTGNVRVIAVSNNTVMNLPVISASSARMMVVKESPKTERRIASASSRIRLTSPILLQLPPELQILSSSPATAPVVLHAMKPDKAVGTRPRN